MDRRRKKQPPREIDPNELERILEANHLWVTTAKRVGEPADLRNADLRGHDIRGANLEGADLAGADLRGVDLLHTNLWKSNLQDVDMSDAKGLSSAQLAGANLSGAMLPAAMSIPTNREVPKANASSTLRASRVPLNRMMPA